MSGTEMKYPCSLEFSNSDIDVDWPDDVAEVRPVQVYLAGVVWAEAGVGRGSGVQLESIDR